MAERLVRNLAIEEALQTETKKKFLNTTISHISTGVLNRKREKTRTRLNLPLRMIWSGRSDHMVGGMTPLDRMPS